MLEHLPAFLRLSDTELLHFLELMYSEDTPCVFAVRSSLLPETGRVTGVLDRKLLFGSLEPLVRVEGGDGLFGSSDQVLVVFVAGHLCPSGQTRP